ncbi:MULTISPECIES: Rv2578c family radical SAM protein [unclassified Cryobacterium]|uniref:Rv2578c family radical SAM protein n=1 Tax=unclassified Cryobacterium TaxID=2649013 RepID=UPI00187FFBAA|nr:MULTISPECIES: Rv2578c family radical SAM protein [unclassified Cryobacterium]
MRWSGQELTTEQAGALPGLARLNNLVRSVRTPEFAGITFHEILAKSALNRVPGQSAMPFGWTINPYRGCSHACTYCLSPETLILMADGRQKPLWEVRVGDAIMGTETVGAYRRYVQTKVLASWDTRKRGYRVTLADGTELVASGDHRFLTERGWRFVTRAMRGDGQRPYLTENNKLMGFGLVGPAIDRKLSIAGAAVKSAALLQVVSVEDLGTTMDMIDITTGTGDFIANGVISHNCFARNTHTYLDLDAGKDFDNEIIVKVNVAEVLRKELARPAWERNAVALGTNTDPYQRAEGRYRLMPGVIAALADSGTPLSILTKGTLIRRDLDLLVEASTLVPVDLALSIAIYDDELQSAVEPGTPSTAARLATVTAIRERGLRCSVFMMPILPFLTDTRAHLDDALRQAKAAGASDVMYSALHLRPGVRDWFMQWLARDHPDLVPRYHELYGRNAYAPKGYRQWLALRIKPLIRAHGLEHGIEDPVTGGVRSRALARPAPAVPAFPGRPVPGPGLLIAGELPPELQPTLF